MSLSVTTDRNPDSFDPGGTIVLPMDATNGQTNNAGDHQVHVGDIVCWDGTNYTLYTPSTQSDMAHFVGVAEQRMPFSSSIDSSATTFATLLARYSGIVYMFATSGDTYNPLAPVYFNENASVQTVTSGTNSGARTVPVGYYVPSNAALVAGAAGSTNGPLAVTNSTTLIGVWLVRKTPNAAV